MELLLRVSLCLLTFIGKSLSGEIEWVATEDSDIILPCSPIGNDDLTDQVFDWKKNDTPKEQEVFLYDSGTHYNNGKPGQNESFKNRVEFFQDKLRFGNASIRIKKTKLTDAGIYSCAFPFLQPPEQKVYVKLVVGTCPMPIIKVLGEEQDGVKVQCEVRGAFPEPKMELLNHANETIDTENNKNWNGNYFDINLQALVNKKDFYRCVVKQEKICHQIYSEETFVPMPPGSSNTTVVAVSLAVVFGVLLLGALGVIVYLVLKKNQSGREGKTDDSTDDGTEDAASSDERNHLGAQDNE